MNALMATFGARASHSSICESELSWALRDAGLVTRRAATRNRCLQGPLHDADRRRAGIQATCRVELTTGPGASRANLVAVPPCGDATSGRCFTIAPDRGQCGDTDSQLAVEIIGGQGDATVSVHCDVDEAVVAPATGPGIETD